MTNQVNEFCLKFANVNGSGSASANTMFAKAVYRMGVPVSAKNIFPSNIQGAPTWYIVRASEKGFTGSTASINISVAMNVATFDADVQEVVPGGYIFYDDTIKRRFNRDDIQVISMPLTNITMEAFGNVKQRFLYRNLVTLGALCHLLDMEEQVFTQLIAEEFERKPKLIEPNITAFQLGLSTARDSQYAIPQANVSVQRRNLTEGKIMVTGNEAAGFGAVCAGATFCAWYPITPSTSVAEGFTKYAEKFRRDDNAPQEANANFAVVQAEDELAAAGMVIGAAWNGARAFTATSGPGVSLMSEFIGLAYFAEIPFVLVNVQRGGPSTGMPTRTQQSDILLSAYASHGDTNHPMLFPANPTECFEMTSKAFDYADRLQTPIMVMTDLDIGMNDWVCDAFNVEQFKDWDRGKIISAQQLEDWPEWGRYKDMDGDSIPWRSLPGTHENKGAYLTRGTSHNEYGGYTEDGAIHSDVLDRIQRKFYSAKQLMPAPQWQLSGATPSKELLLYFGSTEPAMPELLSLLGELGKSIDTVRLLSYPFHDDFVAQCSAYEKIFVIEQNRDGQMRKLLLAETTLTAEQLQTIRAFDGMPVIATHLLESLAQPLGLDRRMGT